MANPFQAAARGISNLLSRAVVRTVSSATKCQSLQISMAGNESKSDIEHFEPYGLTCSPHPGAEAVAVYFDGDRSHGVVLVVSDRRYRIKGLAQGEVAFYDDLGQSVTLKRSGIVVDGGGQPIIFKNAPRARFEMSIEATGDIKDNCDGPGVTMADMRLKYNGHTHKENGDGGGTTDATTQKMEA